MQYEEIKTSEDLKEFLKSLELKQTEGLLSPIYCISALNYIFSLDDINNLMTEENKKTAKLLWDNAKLKGVQLDDPAILS